MQDDRRVGDVRWVNPGSVGMPYEGDVAAFWAIVDGTDVELRRTAFDVDAAAAAIRGSGWPDAESFVTENLLERVEREAAIEAFEPRG